MANKMKPLTADQLLLAVMLSELLFQAVSTRFHAESCSDKGKHLIWAVSLIISITRGGTSHFSTDLDLGRRPELKSDEKCEVPPLVIEVMRCGSYNFCEKGDPFIRASLHGTHAPYSVQVAVRQSRSGRVKIKG